MARRQCTADAKSTGNRCEASAIKGGTVCVSHGGGAGQVQKKAQERIQTEKAHRAVFALGRPRAIDPHAALLGEVHRTQGNVDMLELMVGELTQERLVGGITKTIRDPLGGQTTTVEAVYNVWYRMWMDERKQLLAACREAIRCGVEQARVELEQSQGALIADVFRAVFADETLGLSADQRRRALAGAAQRLRLVDGGSGSA